MKRTISLILTIFCVSYAWGVDYDRYFSNRTLRLDYSFCGDSAHQQIFLDEVQYTEGWYGRRHHLNEYPSRGNGQVEVRDVASGAIIYCNAFSNLFQEWVGTKEATQVQRSFENVFLVPFPKSEIDVTIRLFDFHADTVASVTHRINPADIMIRPVAKNTDAKSEVRMLLAPQDVKNPIDLVILAEGYTAEEMPTFFKDAEAATKEIFRYEPFHSLANHFCVRAVGSVSRDSGVSVPREGMWKNTTVNSHFDTFYSDRYLTTLHMKQMHDALVDVPYEHIIILANTDTYGGGGFYNTYEITAAHHPKFLPVVVHEFGHSFAGLADEYAYDDQYTEFYYPDLEPWEANITTKADFASKWQDMMGKDGVDLIEGGGYQTKGVWRPCDNCRMRTNEAPDFCPVCTRELRRLIKFYTE